MEMRKVEKRYLDGAIPYSEDVIREYTAKGWWLDLTYGDILDRAAARNPEKIAVIDARNKVTYRELKEKVDRCAIAFLDLGIRRYDRLIFHLPNRYEFLVAFYATQRIGAVPVIAAARHDYQEISHFFKITEAVGWIVVAKDGKRDFVPLIERIRAETKSLTHVIMPDDGGALPDGALSMVKLIGQVDLDRYPPDYLAQFSPNPNDVAVIFTTGGTTGLPKGVPRTHNSFLSNVRYTTPDGKPEDVRAQVTPIGHTMAHQGAVGAAIFHAATLVLVPVPRGKDTLEAVQQHRVTHVSLVPTLLEDILNEPHLGCYDLSSLKHVRTAGAALRPDTAGSARELMAQLGAAFGGNAFGSTEGPNARDPIAGPPSPGGSIGKPGVPGDVWKVIDKEERELPSNTEGELVARGPAVFTGYYKSEEENKTIFTHDGYYKMGDLGYIDNDGFMFITGRKKDIIQRGGEGIIPKQIEDLLHRLPSVEACAVVGMPDARLGEKACAFVVLREGARLTFEEMVNALKGMGASVLLLPEGLEIVEQLPRTDAGKIDKKVLRRDIRRKLEREAAVQK